MSLSKNWFMAIFILLFVFGGLSYTHAQSSLVTTVISQTDDNLIIRAWISKSEVFLRRELVVRYEIKNNRDREIFLVKAARQEISSRDGEISIGAPVPSRLGHGDYDYSFQKISPAGKYTGEVTIPGYHVDEPGRMAIRMALGFVDSTESIDRDLKVGEDPMLLQTMLLSRLQPVFLGEMGINVVKGEVDISKSTTSQQRDPVKKQ